MATRNLMFGSFFHYYCTEGKKTNWDLKTEVRTEPWFSCTVTPLLLSSVFILTALCMMWKQWSWAQRKPFCCDCLILPEESEVLSMLFKKWVLHLQFREKGGGFQEICLCNCKKNSKSINVYCSCDISVSS